MLKDNQVQAQTVAPRSETHVAEKLGKVGLVGGAALMASSLSSAEGGLDVAPLVTEIAANGTSMTTVMLAVLTLVALFVGYRMIKRSMS